MLDKLKNLSEKVTSKKPNLRKKDDYLVGLDIGTEFVKALIARIGDNELEIVGVGRKHQELSDMQAGAISDISAVVANCDDALNQAEQQAGVSARSAVIGIAGELVKGTTMSIRVNRKDPNKPLDLAEVEQIVNLVQNRAESKARQQLAWELGGKSVEIRLVNSALVSIDIDGYRVTNPIGFQGKEVLIQLYTAFAPLIHIGALEKTAEELDLDLLAVAAEPFAVARSVIGDDPNATISAVLMDVGGGTTDLAVINEGGVQGTKMFGIGGRAFTKAVERETETDFTEAERLKIAFSDGRVPPRLVKNIESALSKTVDVWESGVELALGEFDKLEHLPNLMLLCGGGSSLGLLHERLEETDWYKELPFTKRPKVQLISPDQVVGVVDKTGKVNDHTLITAMGLLRVGMDTLYQQDNAEANDSFRQRIERILRK